MMNVMALKSLKLHNTVGSDKMGFSDIKIYARSMQFCSLNLCISVNIYLSYGMFGAHSVDLFISFKYFTKAKKREEHM